MKEARKNYMASKVPPSDVAPKGNAVAQFIIDKLGWISTGHLGRPDPPGDDKYGLMTTNVNPFSIQVCYTSTCRNGDGLAKCVCFKDAAGEFKPSVNNGFGNLCDRLGKFFMSIKMLRLCGKNHGLVTVTVGPQAFRVATVSVGKPGTGLATVQAFGQPTGFTEPAVYPNPPWIPAAPSQGTPSHETPPEDTPEQGYTPPSAPEAETPPSY
jgi:hypothetical protein